MNAKKEYKYYTKNLKERLISLSYTDKVTTLELEVLNENISSYELSEDGTVLKIMIIPESEKIEFNFVLS